MNGAEKGGEDVAAFFDVDGTLVAPPTLESRFFSDLREHRLIPLRNYFLWLARAAQLLPAGIKPIQHANKMYLRGLQADCVNEEIRTAGLFRAGIERLAWHAEQGHAIFLISGTIAPLAERMAVEIVMRLVARGITAKIGVCATRLAQRDGCWTGRILGEAMYGEAKARAVRRLAQEHGLDLEGSHAYGNEANDRWMLEAVGRPAAVNPSADLERMARREGWPVLWWDDRTQELTQSSLRTHRTKSRTETAVGVRDLE